MARSIEETTAWVAQVMAEKAGVTATEKVGERSIRISRRDYPPYVAGIVSKSSVSAQDVRDVLASDPTVDIVINVPSQGIWTGSAIEETRAAGVAFGGMADLQSCIGKEDPKAHVKPEFAFIERALSQHAKVSGITREADRVFLVHRRGAGDVRVLALYEYELTGEHIRTARERYGQFDLVLISNPNGKPTAGAKSVAEELQVETYLVGGLLGRLNRP